MNDHLVADRAAAAEPAAPAAETIRRPASDSQAGIWFVDQYATDATVYNSPISLTVRSRLDAALLRRALRHVVARHESLRTTFALAGDTVMQHIHAEPRTWWQAVRARDDADLARLERELAGTRFDLGEGPLLRALCVDTGRDETRLLVNVHHAVFDGLSWDIFLTEWLTAYQDLAAGRPPGAGSPARQFRDFQDWHGERLSGPAYDKSLAYWKDKLAGAPPLLALPLDAPRPPVQSFQGADEPVPLTAETARDLRARARQEGVTPLMLLLAAYAVFLHRHTGQQDLLVGVPASLRDRAEAQSLIGHLVNTVVLRHRVSGDLTVRELLAQVKDEVVTSMRHRAPAFEKVVEAVNPGRSTGHAPIFQTMVTLIPKGGARYRRLGLDVDAWRHLGGAAKYDLVLILEEHEDRLDACFEYDTALFRPQTVRAFARRFGTLLRGMLADPDPDPDAAVADLPLLTETEERDLLAAWRTERDDKAVRETVAALFERQVRRTPDRVAVEFADRTLTYRELNEQANRLARALRARGAGVGTRVALFLDRGLETIVGLLAVLKTGACYVPVDPAYPRDRIEFMLADSRAGLVVTRGAPACRVPPGAAVFDLDAELPAARSLPGDDLSTGKSPGDEIYLIYTSGSTGRPKGVVINDVTIANLVHRQRDLSGPHADARTLQYMSLSFDVSAQEIFGTLCAGGTLVPADAELRTDLHRLVAFVDERRIARLYLPYIALHQIATIVARDRTPLRHLVEVYTTGEQLVVTPQLREMFAACTDAALLNIYGPSESHLCTAHRLPDDPWSWPEAPPIGRTVPNVRLLVLDERGRPVPPGVSGELYVGGPILSPGYNGLPEQTRARFAADPFDRAPGARLYRTGDLVRQSADGVFTYLGRADDQVKIRGYRIEPAEIEAALNDLGFVDASAVVAVECGPGDRRLVAYLVAARRVPEAELRRRLGAVLPDYMVPWRFVHLDALPTTPSGKIDRRALPDPPEPGGGSAPSSAPGTAASSPTQRRIRDIWAGLLGHGDIGLDDDFFALGGHSVLAVGLSQALREEFGIDVPLRTLLSTPTVAGMADCVQRARTDGGAGRTDDDLASVLRGDARLPARITTAGVERAAPADGVRHVLLTGATGFLGGYLLRSLLAAGCVVHCLVRAEDERQARERIMANARRYLLADHLDLSRVHVVPGDLTRERFGMDARRYAALAGRIDAVHHTAAHINFAAPYASVKPANVDGFVRIVEFCAERVLKPLHYTSTLAVFSPRRAAGVITEDSVPDEPRGLGIGYAQSKWVAERLALAARERGVPVTVYRIGRVGGDSVTGACRADDFFWLQLKSFVRLGLAPDDPGRPVDLLPADVVADMVTGLSRTPRAENRTLHVFHPRGLDWSTVFEVIRGQGYALRTVPADAWLDALAADGGDDGRSLAALVPLFREGAMELGDHVYANTATGDVLRSVGMDFPEADAAWVASMIRHFRAAGELPAAPGSPASAAR
ncbi:amino acid adenylation domain-containing protein/thioester reductase domain-containing protein [Thermomonospora echinospora]|uniref:Amino acid adenylation domain-containing protein/thioester reductase domain-containing protein n=1 Tax=Thermomonospora echinospora TaxID=1992 RepID=A0A1H6DDX5_9ACTN|nr:non-ribosomal peptide synthetase [Thermomonospora echinospora]SEG83667.1 amino acid adenylation domain-containing protein/thioester reductase domain-containing protein [Thermomonospora echinospora]